MASIISNNLSKEVIQSDPNKIVNQNNFNVLENEKNHHIEDKKLLDARLNNLEEENLNIISSIKEPAKNSEIKIQTPRRKRVNLLDALKTAQENSEQKLQENNEAKSQGLLATTGLFISRPSQNATIDKSQQMRTLEKASNDSNTAPDKDAPTQQETPRRTF